MSYPFQATLALPNTKSPATAPGGGIAELVVASDSNIPSPPKGTFYIESIATVLELQVSGGGHAINPYAFLEHAGYNLGEIPLVPGLNGVSVFTVRGVFNLPAPIAAWYPNLALRIGAGSSSGVAFDLSLESSATVQSVLQVVGTIR